MLEAEPAELRRAAVARPLQRWRAKFAGLLAVAPHADAPGPFHAAVKPWAGAFLALFSILVRHRLPALFKTGYIGRMTDLATGSVQDQITARLTATLAPTHLVVVNESGLHAGHMGDDGTGETHFRVEVETPKFEGLNRVARQRLVNQALADLLSTQIHALAIKARAPGE